MKPLDVIFQSINQMDVDRHAGWQAFYRKDAECDELRLEIKRLKSTISRLRKK
jgi:hypothetical protein